MSDHPNYHPGWRIASNLTLLAVLLFITATDFDLSELTTIGAFLAGNGLIERIWKG